MGADWADGADGAGGAEGAGAGGADWLRTGRAGIRSAPMPAMKRSDGGIFSVLNDGVSVSVKSRYPAENGPALAPA